MPAIVVSAPAVFPVDVEAIKRQLRIAPADVSHDVDALEALEAAVAEIDAVGRLGRAMITQDIQQVSGPRISDWELEITPVQSVVSVEARGVDGGWVPQNMAAFTLIGDGDRSWLRARRWPSVSAARPDAIRVTYRAGFGDQPQDVPADLRHAVRLLAAHRFEMREEVVAGSTLAQMPNGVEAILSRHRVRSFT